jgi:hypothetical protein
LNTHFEEENNPVLQTELLIEHNNQLKMEIEFLQSKIHQLEKDKTIFPHYGIVQGLKQTNEIQFQSLVQVFIQVNQKIYFNMMILIGLVKINQIRGFVSN